MLPQTYSAQKFCQFHRSWSHDAATTSVLLQQALAWYRYETRVAACNMGSSILRMKKYSTSGSNSTPKQMQILRNNLSSRCVATDDDPDASRAGLSGEESRSGSVLCRPRSQPKHQVSEDASASSAVSNCCVFLVKDFLPLGGVRPHHPQSQSILFTNLIHE